MTKQRQNRVKVYKIGERGQETPSWTAKGVLGDKRRSKVKKRKEYVGRRLT